MLYQLLKPFIQLAFFFFYKKIVVKNKHLLQAKGPLLLTVNHPNALLDALLIGLLFKQPIHFLTRGDAFNKSWKRKLLSRLNMIPVYRLRDGIENLHLNEYAFSKSKEVLQNNGIVLIFIEGICKHTHELQPFKKGAARIAFSCWNDGIPLQVMPISIRYHSLFAYGKQIHVQLQSPFTKTQLKKYTDDAKNYLFFNSVLFEQLSLQLNQSSSFESSSTGWLKAIQLLGKWLHYPVYIPVQKWVAAKTKGTVFYDSILFAALMIAYPLYLIIIAVFLNFLGIHCTIILTIVLVHLLLALFTVKTNTAKD